MTDAVMDAPAEQARPARPRMLPSLALRDMPPRPPLPPRAGGRPAGEVRQALLDAVRRLSGPQRAPTALEIAHAAQVGRVACASTLSNMLRAEELVVVRRRHVAYSRRPVVEYGLPGDDASRHGHGWVEVARCVQGWAR